MITYYKNGEYDITDRPVMKRFGKMYDDNIYTFDIETTSVFVKDNHVIPFDYTEPSEWYNDCEKLGYMYIWQFSINENVYYGRTWDEFKEFITTVRAFVTGDMIIYVHNLGFEFQYLRNIINDFDVFARKPLHPVTARSKEYGVEFRCSLMLTNASLAKVPDLYHLDIQKMVGDLDYRVMRNSKTVLTKKELGYCEHDCLVVYKLIEKMKEEYGTVYNIPLTQTGRLRRKCREMYKGDTKYYKNLKKQLPENINDLVFALKAFSGGYTHANSNYTGKVVSNVHSRDLSSSYPTVMVAEKFPCSQFMPSRAKTIEEIDNSSCWLIDIEFFEIYSVKENNYLSISKSITSQDIIGDNGRMAMAKSARYIITDVDLDIIKQCYKWSSYKIHEARRADKGYLDKKFVYYILQLFGEKTSLKNIEGQEAAYQQAKQYINAMYGMTVTNLISDEVKYNEGQDWIVHEITPVEAQDKLDHINNDRRTFLNQYWGIFVTAYARHNLWSVILKIDEDVVYDDTDSVKFVGVHDDVFDAYNEEIDGRLRRACRAQGIDEKLIEPLDSFGQSHHIGYFEKDDEYDKFITLGAKKYADIKKGKSKISMTVSGVNPTIGATAINNIKDFKTGLVFDYSHSGKLTIFHNDEQCAIILKDVQGHETEEDARYGICMMPCEYTLGITKDYAEYISGGSTHYTGGGF